MDLAKTLRLMVSEHWCQTPGTGYLTLEDDTLMQWCVDNDFCGEAAKAVRYDSDFVWEGEPWPAGEYIVSEKDRKAIYLSDILVKEN